MKKVTQIRVMNSRNHTVSRHEIVDPLEDWFRKDGSITIGISHFLRLAFEDIQEGGVMIVSQKWEV